MCVEYQAAIMYEKGISGFNSERNVNKTEKANFMYKIM